MLMLCVLEPDIAENNVQPGDNLLRLATWFFSGLVFKPGHLSNTYLDQLVAYLL